MKRFWLVLILWLPSVLSAQQTESYDYAQFERAIVGRGLQAFLMCNGLFTSDRTLEQVFDQELRYIPEPIGTAQGGDFAVDYEGRAVSVGADDGVPIMHAVYREGLGCVIMPPDQDLDDIDALPEIELDSPPNTLRIPWPAGDLLSEEPQPSGFDSAKLQAASDWAFDRVDHGGTAEQVTLSLIVLQDDRIVYERYAPGVDMYTKTRTWSTAKSIAVTLIGMLVDEGRLSLDDPIALDWLPRAGTPDSDPRNGITLRHLLNMSSGLYPVDNRGLEYATGSGLAYWAGASAVQGALNRGAIREPGTYWDYENYDTILAVYAMKRAIGDDEAYLQYPHHALFEAIGMHNTLPGVDRFGDYVMSSQVYTTARDLARFGLLYLNNGVWMGERLLSEEWIDFVRTPAPATVERGRFYGGQWWLVPDDRTDVPSDAYSTAGNRGQFVIVVPSHNVVIVRRGLDYGRQGFDRWDLAREVLKAFPARD